MATFPWGGCTRGPLPLPLLTLVLPLWQTRPLYNPASPNGNSLQNHRHIQSIHLTEISHFTCAPVCVCVCVWFHLVLSHMWFCVPTTTFKVQNSSLTRRRITHVALLRPHPPLSVTFTPLPTNLLSTSKMLYM